MKSSDLYQVVIPTAEASEEVMAAVRELTEREELILSVPTRIRLVLSAFLHPLGVHHWVGYRTFDPGSGRILVHPRRWVCAYPGCPIGMIEP